MPDYEVIIVGAGPSGCATALELSNLDPALAQRVLWLDRAVFPRTKLCAGGLSADADLALTQLGLDVDRYEPRAACSQHRVLFVGDAAGADPLFGEGISSALTWGIIAAQTTVDALRVGDFSFTRYEKRIRSSSIGFMMRQRLMVAKRLHSNAKLANLLLRHTTLLRGIALLGSPWSSAKLVWEPRRAGRTKFIE